MPESKEIPANQPRGERVLNIRAVVLHNSHVRGGYKISGRCGYCTQGLGGLIKTVEAPEIEQKPDLAEDTRTDKEGDATSPPDSWWNRTET